MLWLCLHLPKLFDARAEPAAATLQGLAAWAWQFTDRVSITSREAPGASAGGPREITPAGAPGSQPFHALLLEIEGSVKLFGGLPALRARIGESFAAFGHPYRCAIAPTPAAAELFALAGVEAPVLHRSLLRERLAGQPLAALALQEETLAALRGVGLRTVGEALTLSPAQLARRFGADAAQYLRRLAGEAPDPRPLYVLPPGWRRRCELDAPVESLDTIGRVLERLLPELAGVLVARDTAVARLALTLEHEEAPASTVELALRAPRRDAAAFLPLLRERLERAPLHPVTALVLEVTEFAEPGYGQHDLFDGRLAREAATRALIERLAARLGEQAVQGIALREDHRPELGFMACPFKPGPAAAPPKGRPAQPFWLLRKPRPLREPPRALGRAQRIESGWWDGAGVARDYYVGETEAGEQLWVFREKERWFLHGLWA